MSKRNWLALVASAGAITLSLLGVSATASASTHPVNPSPSITFFASSIPIIGSTLSDTSLTPNIMIKDGWTITSPNGISHAHVQLCDFQEDQCTTIWTYKGGATSASGTYRWVQSTSEGSYLVAYATDSLGNQSSNSVFVGPWLNDSQGQPYGPAVVYSSGWKTSKCACYTDGSILYSASPGATAIFQTGSGSEARLVVSFVSDTGPTRGTVGISVNGGTYQDVKLTTSSATKNRVIVWNSGYLSNGSTNTVTVKVISGRVDFEGYLGAG